MSSSKLFSSFEVSCASADAMQPLAEDNSQFEEILFRQLALLGQLVDLISLFFHFEIVNYGVEVYLNSIWMFLPI